MTGRAAADRAAKAKHDGSWRLVAASGTFVALLVTIVAGAGSPPADTTAPERFIVPSDGHPMTVWARRPAAPRATLLLVHGRTWSSRPDFDLQVPGIPRSVMASFAARGIAAYAVDLRGYGATPRDPSGWTTPRRSASDVSNVLAWISRQYPALPRPALVGWSRGAAVAMLAAQSTVARASALVMFGFAYDPDARFAEVDPGPRPAKAPNTRGAASSDFISPKVTPTPVVRAFVDQALRSDPVTADLRGDDEFNDLRPERMTVPTLVIFGERDPGVLPDEATKLLARLGTTEKQLVVIRGADHAAHLEDTHEMWIGAVVGFMERAAGHR
ncbi:MAG: alpha/beta fold hydrolase [Vicinamibacterales bacterium]